MAKGIMNRKIQQSILFTMIYEFNEMMSSLAMQFPNVYHIDNRGLAQGQKDWYDELHLISAKFKIIANAYERLIRSPNSLNGKKILRTADLV